MTGRDLAREFVPPALLRLKRRLVDPRPIAFYGIQPGFPVVGDGFTSSRALAWAKKKAEVAEGGDDVPPDMVKLTTLLAVIHETTRPALVDFGGGHGVAARMLRRTVHDVCWRVIEQPAVAASAPPDPDVIVTDDPAAAFAALDPAGVVVLLRATLHYLRWPEATLRPVVKHRPRWMMFSRVPIAPYTRGARQRLHGAEVGVWLYTADDVVALAERLGYRLAETWPCVAQFRAPEMGRDLSAHGFLFVRH